MKPRRLLTIGHSYVVALNRRLANALAVAADGRWEVVAAGPRFMQGDLRPIEYESDPSESCRSVPVDARLTKHIHFMHYCGDAKELLRQQWDMVHIWEEPYILSGWQIARKLPAKTPVVYYSFQNISKKYPPPFGWLERSSIRRSAGWLAAGHTVEETLLKRPGYVEKPHRVMPLGVDTEAFFPDREAGRRVQAALGWSGDGPPVVGYLGRFIPPKGLGLLMGALDRLAAPWRALLVGGGPMEAELRAWGAKYADRVRIVTGVPHGEVPSYLNAMDLLVAPSQTTADWREQLGRMLIEAFACGIPVVASDSGEIPHVVGDAGTIVAEADGAGWESAIGECIEMPTKRAEMAARGLDRVRTKYSWPVVGRQHWEFFDALVL